MIVHLRTCIRTIRPTRLPKYLRASRVYQGLVLSMIVLLLLGDIQGVCKSEVPDSNTGSTIVAKENRKDNIAQSASEKQLNTIQFWNRLGNEAPITISSINEVREDMMFNMHMWDSAKHLYTLGLLDYSIKYRRVLLSIVVTTSNYRRTLDVFLEALQVISQLIIDCLEVDASSLNYIGGSCYFASNIPKYYEDGFGWLMAERLPVNIQQFILHETNAYITHIITTFLIPASANATFIVTWSDCTHSLQPINRAFLMQLGTLEIYYTGWFKMELLAVCTLPNLRHLTLDGYCNSRRSCSLEYLKTLPAFILSVSMKKALSDASITSYFKESRCPLNVEHPLVNSMSLKDFFELKVLNKASNRSDQDGAQETADVKAILDNINASEVMECVDLADACNETLMLVDLLREYASDRFTEDMLKTIKETPELNILLKDALDSDQMASDIIVTTKAGVVYFDLNLSPQVSELLFGIAQQSSKTLNTLKMHHSGLSSLLKTIQASSALFTIDTIDVVGINDVFYIECLRQSLDAVKSSKVNSSSAPIETLGTLKLTIDPSSSYRNDITPKSFVESWMSNALAYLQQQTAIVRFAMITIAILVKDAEKEEYAQYTRTCRWNLSYRMIENLPSNALFEFWTVGKEGVPQPPQERISIPIRTFKNISEDINKIVPVIPVKLYASLIKGVVKDKIHPDYANMSFLNKDYSRASQEIFTCNGCKRCADLRNHRLQPSISNPTCATFDSTLQHITVLLCDHSLCFRCAYPIVVGQGEAKQMCPICAANPSALSEALGTNTVSLLHCNLVLGMLTRIYDGLYAMNIDSSAFAEELKQDHSLTPYWIAYPFEITSKLNIVPVKKASPPPSALPSTAPVPKPRLIKPIISTAPVPKPRLMRSLLSSIHKKLSRSTESTSSTPKQQESN